MPTILSKIQASSLLTQNHEHVIRDFIGLTTAFNPARVKSEVLVMAENKQKPNVRYIYGEVGKGHFTYYSGHDPEGMFGRGRGDRDRPRKTDLNLYPHSPGYRLILNNVLFPSAHKKRQKTQYIIFTIANMSTGRRGETLSRNEKSA